jgi:HD-GYP domain-containing protein (c-di-GMP phosphodiesterase class II)
MQFADLSAVKHRLRLGAPLPFNVRNADKTLLLARGQQVDSAAHLAQLLERGALVDMTELLSPREEVLKAPREALPLLWQGTVAQLSQAMNTAPEPGFLDAVMAASGPLQALVERDPDLAIFQIVQRGADANVGYGARRSMQTAITSLLVAQRLGWGSDEAELAFKVALTMNLSMLELQGALSKQAGPLTAEQRAELHSHPARSAQMLEQAGVTDRAWINAVRQHHEQADGSGYPSGTTQLSELACLVQRADVYTSKLSERAVREPMAADLASRQMFMQDPAHAITAALVKEFGIYPPGCHVRLASGDVAVVVQRGATISTPIVDCLPPAGAAAGVSTPHPSLPVRRDTSAAGYAVVAVVRTSELH